MENSRQKQTREIIRGLIIETVKNVCDEAMYEILAVFP